jgi:hypothetical protein
MFSDCDFSYETFRKAKVDWNPALGLECDVSTTDSAARNLRQLW